MFALIKYNDNNDDRKYFVPASFIRNFDPTSVVDFNSLKPYRTFWFPELLKKQDKPHLLKSLRVPPKSTWNTEVGVKFYSASVLRLGATLEDLIKSVEQKRPQIPINRYQDKEATTTEDEDSIRKVQDRSTNKENNKELSVLTQEAISERRNLFGLSEDEDSDNDISLKYQIKALQNQVSYLMEENKEVQELRKLNRELQAKIIELIGKECYIPEAITPVQEIPKERDLGYGVVLKTEVLNAIKGESNISKFTKSLCVAIWGNEVLKGRSTTGQKCKNIRGRRKKNDEEEEEAMPQVTARQALTPEKLIVISGKKLICMKLYFLNKK